MQGSAKTKLKILPPHKDAALHGWSAALSLMVQVTSSPDLLEFKSILRARGFGVF